MKTVGVPVAGNPVVIVDKCAECVEAQTFAWLYHGFAIIFKLRELTIGIVKHGLEALTLDCEGRGDALELFDTLAVAHHGHFRAVGVDKRFSRYGRKGAGCCSHGKLLFHLDISLLGPRLIFRQSEINIDKKFTIKTGEIIGNSVCGFLARTEIHAGAYEGIALGHFLAILDEAPRHILSKRLEIILC